MLPGLVTLRTKLAASSSARRASGMKGVKICQEGEFSADFFVILSGLIGIYRSDMQGGMKYVRSLGAPSWFGEMSVMSSAPRSATVITEADSVVLSIPRHSFMKLYSANKGKPFKDIPSGTTR